MTKRKKKPSKRTKQGAKALEPDQNAAELTDEELDRAAGGAYEFYVKIEGKTQGALPAVHPTEGESVLTTFEIVRKK